MKKTINREQSSKKKKKSWLESLLKLKEYSLFFSFNFLSNLFIPETVDIVFLLRIMKYLFIFIRFKPGGIGGSV